MALVVPNNKKKKTKNSLYRRSNTTKMGKSQRLIQYICILYQSKRRSIWALAVVALLVLVVGILRPAADLPLHQQQSALSKPLLLMPRSPPALHPFPPAPDTIERLSLYLEGLSTLQERLEYVVSEQPFRAVQVTSLGPSGMVLLDVMHRNGWLEEDIPVWTVDTLHLFPETLDFYATVEKHYSFDLKILHPLKIYSKEKFDSEYGENLYRTDPDKYGFLSKVEPLQHQLDKTGTKIWMTGRRRDQGGERTHLAFAEADGEDRLKLNLLADWTYDQVWTYILDHDVPYNPLHDRGYKSIGDTMTTRAVAASAPERSGRFVGMNQTECGLHHHLEKLKVMKQQAAEQNVEFEMPKLPCDDVCDLEVTLDSFSRDILYHEQPILLEFYSPLCGACQEFAPTFHGVAEMLKRSKVPVTIARFDVTESDITTEMEQAGYTVEVTPTLYLVTQSNTKPLLYDAEDFHGEAIVRWVTSHI